MEGVVSLTLNPAVDASTSVEQVVGDRKLRCDEPTREPGGGGVNVARAIARLGGSCTAVLAAGGPTGSMLDQLLDDEGIDRRTVATSGWTRENLTVHEASTGRQFRFGMPGPLLTEDEWEAALAAVARLDPAPSYVVASGSVPPGVPDDVYARLARLARERGSRLVVDTSGDPLRHAFEEGVFLAKPNLRELGDLDPSLADLEDEEEREQAVVELVRSSHTEAVLVSMGAAGAMLVAKKVGTVRLRAPTVPIRSRIGAGDSTVAGTVLALARGEDLVAAARFGVAAGAAAVMTRGSELCRREDAERLVGRVSVT